MRTRKLGNTDFNGEKFLKNLAVVDALRPIAERSGKTVAQLSIAWVLRREEVTAAIVGARKQSQIEETVQAGDWVLDEQDIMEIENILK